MIYRYGTIYRPAGIGCQPREGLVEITHCDKYKVGYWSIVSYNRELSEKEISNFELKKITKE